MAIGRRVYNEIEFYLDEDDAIDLEKSDYDKYCEDFEKDHLTFIDGVNPTIFRIRPLTYRQRIEMEGKGELIDRCEFAIRCGLWDVENYIIVGDDSEETILSKPEREKDYQLGSLVKKKWLANANFANTHLFKLANAIADISDAKRKKS